MSDYMVSGFKEYAPVTKKTDTDSAKKIRIIKITFAVLCLLLAVEVIIYKMAVPCLDSPKVTFSGLHYYSAHELAQSLVSMNASNWIDFDVSQAASILNSIPGIEAVTVAKRFPDKIYIDVKERQAVAMTFLNENGRSVPVQIDKNGVLFSANTEVPERDGTVPIVSGLPVEHLSGGMRIPAKYLTLIEQIAHIRSLPQKYFAAISEICVVPKEYGNYELVLIPVNSHTRVLTDRTLNEEALQYMMVVLDVVNSIEPDVSEIDLRYGAVSYRKR
ncbi:MAG: FtsQ-type POTRA domain-containing protein [Treponema sp.]|nr:FtsQ-type POTRA domain-containing protein [Treponema sp.]